MKIKDQYIEYLERKRTKLRDMTPQSIADMFANVQPMSINTGEIFKLKKVHKDEY